ncbi:MAG: KOW motif-containing protein [Balneolaceae bacterium]|nr:KOW motif-containing protein [Balneolaceae bacterium]
MKRILGRVKDNEEMMEQGGKIEIPYDEGDLVKVIDGPFKDFDGTVQEVNTDKLKATSFSKYFWSKDPG